jgi:type I restriction enzyme S subunit
MENKDTPIGRIPKDWDFKPLNEIVKVHDSKRIPLSETERGSRKGNYPYCGANGVIDYIDDYIFDGVYVLLAEDGGDYKSFGKSAYLMTGKFWVNNHAHIISAIKNISTNLFTMYSLNFINLERYIVGSTRKKLNQETMRKIKIPLPTLNEQQKIAEILSTTDHAIQKSDEIIAKTRGLKRGTMQKLLNEGIGHEEFKDTPIGKIPVEWNLGKLGDTSIVKLVMGQSPPSSTYNKEGEGLPFLQGKAEFGEIYPKPILHCSEPMKIAEKNDLLLSIRAPVGDVNLATNKYCIGRGLAAIRAKNEKLDHIFLFNYIRMSSARFEMLSTGSTFKAIRKGEIEKFIIPLPGINEQKKIAQILTSIDDKYRLEIKRKEKLQNIKKGLMNDLLTGHKRVHVNN